MAMTQTVQIPKLIGTILLCEGAGLSSGFLTVDGVRDWYPTLRKPSFNPPGALFGPVWTLLYGMMGAALHLVQQRDGADRGVGQLARTLFSLQLALNILWSYIFFKRRSPLYALVEIACLWLAIALTVLAFARISRTAALLMLPYLAWVSFASALNYAIWRLNT